LKENERVHTERNQNKISLIINSTEEVDAGVYTIKATNEVAQDLFNVNVIVEGNFYIKIAQKYTNIIFYLCFSTPLNNKKFIECRAYGKRFCYTRMRVPWNSNSKNTMVSTNKYTL
jgi:hypothetical protein